MIAAAAVAAGQSLSCPKSFLGHRTPRSRRRGSTSFTSAAAAAPAALVRNSNSDSDLDSDSSSNPATTLYDVLGVPAFAAAREIKAAYRRLARERHPDVAAAAAAAEQSGGGSAEEFIRIHAAYATLSDPNKRAEYDRDVMRRRTGGCRQVCSYGGPPTPGRMPRRSWETDQCW